jgi:hypothetical protein
MAGTPMSLIGKRGRYKLYLARGAQFFNPGVYLWTGKRHRLLLPFQRPRKVEED